MSRSWQSLRRRLRQFERREARDLRRWLEQTNTFVHVSLLIIVPLLIGLVTMLANVVNSVSFLLYPPLASGAYTLFANPEGRYASPVRFVGGLTVGAICGWVAVQFAIQFLYTVPAGQIHSAGAALGIFLTGAVTWALGVEVPAAYATALLTLFVNAQIDNPEYFVLSVAVSSAIVAGTFLGWRRWIYERRADYLYESINGDDHVLVPLRGPNADATAMLAARLAAAHRAGKVVLLDVVDDEWVARAERSLLERHGETRLRKTNQSVGDGGLDSEGRDPMDTLGAKEMISESVSQLEGQADDIETKIGVPCEVAVAVQDSSPASTVLQTARQANCDLVAVPYEAKHGSVTAFIRDLFRADIDVIVHRSQTGRTDWKRVLVPVRRASDVAHSMLDFASRLTGQTGIISVGSCVSSERERRRAEDMLADLVETFEGNIETRISRIRIEKFLSRNSHEYDIVILGASQDRSAASRFISPPTFERIDSDELDADVAIVDRH